MTDHLTHDDLRRNFIIGLLFGMVTGLVLTVIFQFGLDLYNPNRLTAQLRQAEFNTEAVHRSERQTENERDFASARAKRLTERLDQCLTMKADELFPEKH